MKHYKRTRYRKFKRRTIVILFLVFISCVAVLSIKKIHLGNPAENIIIPIPQIGLHTESKKPEDNISHSENTMDKREDKLPVGIDMDSHFKELGTKDHKTAYLTFDDGPSPKTTSKILDILDKYHIKATFFVIGKQAAANRDLIIRENKEGDAIGNHTYTHDYKYIYTDPQNLLDDLNKCSETIHSILGPGYKIKYFRFPGGAYGKKRDSFREAVENAGYSFIDWNSLNGDAEGNNIPPGKLVDRLKQTSKGKRTLIILMHDAPAKQTTIIALPQIIEYLKSEGFIFKTL